MRIRSFSLTMFHKLLLSFLAVALIPLSVVWYAGTVQERKDAAVSVSQHLTMTAAGIATGINSWDDANVRMLRAATRLDDIASMNAARQTPILRALGDTYEWAFVVFTVDPTGDNVARSDDKTMTKFGDRSYFQEAIKGAATGRQVLISKSTGKPALTLGVPIKNASGSTVGVIAMAMKLDDIAKVIKDTRIGQTGYAILLDGDSKMIASGRPDKSKDAVQDMADYPALKVQGIDQAPTIYHSDGKRMVGYLRTLPQGWTLLVEQEYTEAYASLIRLESAARLLILLTGGVAVAAAFLLGKQLTGPLDQLTQVAEQLGNGNFDDDVPCTERGDELGALARAVEHLGESIRMAKERLRRKA